jgi:PEP-CTERM motif
MRGFLASASLAAFLACASAASAGGVQLLTNGSFEGPNLGATNYTYPGTSIGTVTGYSALLDGWTYSNAALVNAQGYNAWYGSAPPAGMDGVQFAALQSTSTLSQTFSVSSGEAGHDVTLSWLSAGRPNFGGYAGDQSYLVLLDGAQVGQFSTVSGQNFTAEDLNLGALTAGSHTLEFEGLATNDETSFLDNVSAVAAVPEPATWTMLILGVAMIGSAARRRREGMAVAA